MGRANAGPPFALRLEAYVLAVLVRIILRTTSLKRAGALLARVPRRRAGGADTAATCLGAASEAAARVAHPTCLFESLVAFALLARRGYDVVLHVGARREAGLEAHAWVTIAGRPCQPEALLGYTEFWRVVAASGR